MITEEGWQDKGFKPPLHIDPKRVDVRYKEQGGADADGVIFVRPGVNDISLGQVALRSGSNCGWWNALPQRYGRL
jgi:hypothetical protein